MSMMSSFLDKLLRPGAVAGRRQNPYIDPHHPNHASPAPPAPTSTTEQCFSSSSPQAPSAHQSPRPTSPREPPNYLAEAREALGRDRVTGQPRDWDREQISVEAGEEREERAERSVYRETSEGRSNTLGTKYDLFVQEMKARKVGAWKAPESGFYAPERRLHEFYSGRSSG